MNKPKTMTQRIKEFGAKVTRTMPGWYTYHGVNFTVGIMDDECGWRADVLADGVDPRLEDHYQLDTNFETKKELVGTLFFMDQHWNEEWMHE